MVFVHLYLVQLNFVMPIINKKKKPGELNNDNNIFDIPEFEQLDVNLNTVKVLIYWQEEHHSYFHNNNEKYLIFYYQLLLLNEDQLPVII